MTTLRGPEEFGEPEHQVVYAHINPAAKLSEEDKQGAKDWESAQQLCGCKIYEECSICKPKRKTLPVNLNSAVSPLSNQVGGGHYKDMPIQPVEFCQKNRIPFCEASAIKYICRHKKKNGVEDVRKAIHFLKMLLELEYNVKE